MHVHRLLDMPELIIYLLTWLDYRDWLNYSIFLICLPTCSDCSVVEVPEGRYRGHNPKTAPPEKKGKGLPSERVQKQV